MVKWHIFAPLVVIVGGVFGVFGAIFQEVLHGSVFVVFVGGPMIEEVMKPTGVYLILAFKQSVLCSISNQWNPPNQEDPNYGGSESYRIIPRNELEYYDESDFSFTTFGARNLYPYDSYMMNFTISISGYNNSKEDNTEVSIISWPLEWHQETELPKFNIKNTDTSSKINFQIIIYIIALVIIILEITRIIVFNNAALANLIRYMESILVSIAAILIRFSIDSEKIIKIPASGRLKKLHLAPKKNRTRFASGLMPELCALRLQWIIISMFFNT